MLTEIDRDRNDRKEQRRKEKRAEEFADDISVEGQQGDTRIEGTNIGNKRIEAGLAVNRLPGPTIDTITLIQRKRVQCKIQVNGSAFERRAFLKIGVPCQP